MIAAVLLALAVLAVADVLSRLAARRAARAHAALAGELAFHRHTLRELDARGARRAETIAAQVDALTRLLAARRPCGGDGEGGEVPVPVEMPETEGSCAPQPLRCRKARGAARPADGPPDAVRGAVWRALAADPRILGPVVYTDSPTRAWRPVHRLRPDGGSAPAVLITTWGQA